MSASIACIVEGHGEVIALPILIRRIVAEVNPNFYPDIRPPIRQSRSSLIKDRGIENAVELAARSLLGKGGILVLIDADDDCPAQLGPRLLRRAQLTRSDLPIAVVLAKREFEAWFISAAESLRGYRGLPSDLVAPNWPEGIRGAKSWIERRMGTKQYYSEILDQAKLTARFDLTKARQADSFDKFYRDVVRVIDGLQDR